MQTLRAFLLGLYEFRRSFTTGFYDANGEEIWHLYEAYGHGRDWAHALTFRRYEN